MEAPGGQQPPAPAPEAEPQAVAAPPLAAVPVPMPQVVAQLTNGVLAPPPNATDEQNAWVQQQNQLYQNQAEAAEAETPGQTQVVQPQAQPQATNDAQDTEGSHEDTEEDSDHDGSESDEEVDGDTHWEPINEDTSEATGDELSYINSRGPEHAELSATDDEYWEKLAYFDPNDPDIVPGESGTIDWLIDRFNGTAENPNNELVMRSPTISIGGYDWRIKFYPKGHRSDYLSAYLENVTLQSPKWEGTEDFVDPPFPFLAGHERIKKRRSVAAQLCLIMYNPAEPRVFEYKAEAHQFHKDSADYGWRYFTQYPRYEIHVRQHLQRQAILRNDRLAFRAYIRVVDDPTGCKWEHGLPSPDMITSTTGLRPFTKSLQYVAAAVPLLHFQPFREFVKTLDGEAREGDARKYLQGLLLKMYTRKRSANFGSAGHQYSGDVMEMLWRVACRMRHIYGEESEEFSKFKELVGAFHPDRGGACGASRLDTADHPSIQEAVDAKTKVKPIACPQLLTLELQRQEHDKRTRKWKKITNKVEVSDQLTVQGVSYTLFAFVTHCGSLVSSRYVPYVRPAGPGKHWYAYHDGKVTILTDTEARGKHSGFKDPNRAPSPGSGYDSPFSTNYDDHRDAEVTCSVLYVREDAVPNAFSCPDVEVWVPKNVPEYNHDDPPRTAVHENFPTATQIIGGAQWEVSANRDHISRLSDLVEQNAAAARPLELSEMDGEDVVMRDVDDSSQFSIDQQSTEPTKSAQGTHDWLGQHYYEGDYDATKQVHHGGGHLIDVNGDEYLGQFKDGKKSGHGKIIYAATGNFYEGDWINDLPHGKGKLTEASGNVYEGDFKEGRKTGQFVLRGTVTDEDKGVCTICFDQPISTAFYDCGHVVACRDCADRIDDCPVCRKRVLHRLQLFGVTLTVS